MKIKFQGLSRISRKLHPLKYTGYTVVALILRQKSQISTLKDVSYIAVEVFMCVQYNCRHFFCSIMYISCVDSVLRWFKWAHDRYSRHRSGVIQPFEVFLGCALAFNWAEGV